MHILQIFSTILQVAFSTLFSVLCCTEVLRLISFVYLYFVTNTCALGTISKKSLLIQCREASSLFSSKSLIKSCIQVLNPFRVNVSSRCKMFIILQMVILFPQHHSLQGVNFPHYLDTLDEDHQTMYPRVYFCLSILFH